MMSPATAGCSRDSTDKQKGQATLYSAQPSANFNNTDAPHHSKTDGQFQQRTPPRDILTVPKGPAVDMLRMAALAFSSSDLVAAQRFYETMMLARSAWLAANNKRLPDPDWLDRQRYGTKRREAA